MVTSAELKTLALTLAPPNDELLSRAAHYLATFEGTANESERRSALETAHNLVNDVTMNFVLLGQVPSADLLLYEDVLAQARIDTYGSIGRPVDMTPPYWRP